MSLQFTCGHWATDDDDVGNYVALKRQDVDHDGWKNVIHYATYCDDCFKKAFENGEALHSYEEMTWLMGVDV